MFCKERGDLVIFYTTSLRFSFKFRSCNVAHNIARSGDSMIVLYHLHHLTHYFFFKLNFHVLVSGRENIPCLVLHGNLK